MNIISGNCAGVFSGFLSHLSWMEISDNPNNEIKVLLHCRNKTHYPGNSYSNYKWFNSKNCNNFDEILNENLLLKFFKKNEYLKTSNFDECIYTECYPIDIQNLVKNYPNSLKYEGRGGLKEQYYDPDNLNLTRNAFHKQWNKFSFSESFAKKVEQEEKILKGKKSLCLMLRQTEHYQGYKYGGTEIIDKAIDTVKSKLDNYDSVLLTTQVGPFLDKFIEVFGDRCLYTDRPRFDQDIDWKGGRYSHTPMTDDEYELEYQNAMLDVILSSKTDLLIGGSSNMFLAALGMNPSIQFDMFCSSNGL